MNKNLLIATAVTAGASALFYMVRRKLAASKSLSQAVTEHSRHLTNVFAKAKHT